MLLVQLGIRRSPMLIEKAFNPENFEATAARILPLLSNYLREAHKGSPVLNWTEPSKMLPLVGELIQGRVSPEVLARRFLELTNHIHSPKYMGHQVPPPIPLAALFDFVGSVVNQGAAVYEMGPFSTGVERHLSRILTAKVGYTTGDGFATHGGSIANLTAILSARNTKYGDAWKTGIGRSRRPAILTSPQSHYSVMRSAGIIGLGTDAVLPAPLNSKRSVDVSRVAESIDQARRNGFDPFCFVASSCSTPTGAYDDLEALSDVCREKGLWLHVDGAHGMSVLFSKKYRHLVRGVEKSDSVIWDAHKMLYLPSLVTFVFFKDKEASFKTFQQDAPYLLDPRNVEHSEFNGGYRTLECTKRSIAMGLGAVFATYGEELFEELVDRTYDLARSFHRILDASSDFAVLHEPESNIVCFRYVPSECKNVSDLQKAVRKKLLEKGEFYITSTELDGATALRVTLINPFTTEDHLKELLKTIRGLKLDDLPG